MKPSLSFVVPGDPIPCARPRAFALMRKGAAILKNGRPIIREYTEDRTEEYEGRVALFCRQALARYPEWQNSALAGHLLRVHLHFVRRAARGDLDNFQKAALDGIKKANDYRLDPTKLVRGKPAKILVRGAFRDDSRISQCLASMHTDPKAEPRTEVTLETANVLLAEPLWQHVARIHGWGPIVAGSTGT